MLVRDWSDERAGHRPAIAVLGALEVRTPDGDLVPISARKHADLLVILTAERSVRSAGRLCELLWRGAPPDSAMVTLQGYVLRLRRALAAVPDIRIDTAGGGYVLRCVGPSTDLDLLDVLSRDAREAYANGEVERAVDLLGDALALWRGDALTEIDDVIEIAPERARLDELRTELTEMCAEGLIALGRARQAVAMLTEARGRHPLRESTARLSALVLRDSGRTSEALDVLVDLRRRMRDELGLDPSSDTERLEAELRRPPAPAAEVEPESRLYGREAAAAALDRAWRTSTRDLTVVTVRGPAGIGKSSIVTDAVRRHHSTALVTGGVEGVKSTALESVSTLLDQAAINGRSVPADPGPRTLAAVLAAMAREDGHVVVVVDDVQWVDVDSLRMIAGATRILRGRPVLVVLIARSERLSDEAAGSVRTLQAIGVHQTIELAALSDAAVADLVDAELGSAAAEVRDTIVHHSGGSPFVAAQLCDLVRAGRDLTAASVAGGVLRIKLDSVSRPARELAELLAVSGTSTSAAVAMAADASSDFDARVQELVAAHLVTRSAGAIEFTHDLVRAAVLDPLGSRHTAHVHRRIAAALEMCTPDALTAIAAHRSAAAADGIDAAAAIACAAAARSALDRSALRECVDHATRGLRHARPDDIAVRTELDTVAGQAHTRLGRYDDAAECFERAGRRCIGHDDWVGLGRIVLLASSRGVGGYFSGYGVIQSGSGTLRAQALAHRGVLGREMIAQLLAVSVVESAVHGLPDDLDQLAEAFAYTERYTESWQQVRLAEFICIWDPTTVAERSAIADELSDLAGDREARATALHLRRVCALEAGDLRLVRRLSAEFARLAADGGADATAMQVWWQVMIAVLRGQYEQSHALMRQLADGLGAVDGPARILAEASMLTAHSIELWHQGRLAEALPEVDRMTDDFDDDFALVAAMAYAEVAEYDRALRLVERILAHPGRLHGPRLAIRVPLLIEALLVIGADAQYRCEVERFAGQLEPYTEGWGDELLVQWPGLVCLGPAGLYRGTVRGILGRPDATALVDAAMRRARILGAHPYERRAADRLTRWPFVRS
ncbi:MAG: BTAD domain-containing putative transcriptional regulator [Actinomycetota bacterium]|nr:BTAD domain-containing putative transcriptional regulator [Actinomycetota bacterium]